MLPKANRLKRKKDFDQVFKYGTGIDGSFLFLKVRKTDSDQKRFGFVVSQKVSKKAVVRNKTKRRLREAVREVFPQVISGIDVILVAKPKITDKEFCEIEEAVEFLFRKAKILNE